MAERALKKLEDQLNCAICLDTYTTPKVLQCFHVYCQQCLQRLVLKDQHGELTLTCPTCRQVSPVPSDGVAGLQAAFQINQLLEIVEEHKKAKGQSSGSASATANTSSAPLSSVNDTKRSTSPQSDFCPEHRGKELELYCETCEKLICLKCVIKDGKHHSHNYEEVSKAFEKCKGEIMSLLAPMEEQVEAMDKALEEFDVCGDEISHHQATITRDIHLTMARLRETLDIRESALLLQLDDISQAKLKCLSAQRDQVVTTKSQLSSCLHFMKETIETSSQREVLLMKTVLADQVSELTSGFQTDMLKPSAKSDIVFSASADLTEECEKYGQVAVECYATGKGLKVAAVGVKTKVALYSLDEAIVCELVSEITDTRIQGSIESKGLNQYEISYQPTIKGKHLLHVKVSDKHIKGSPFAVSANSPVEQLGTPILTINEIKGPEAVAINGRGEVLVTNQKEHTVSIFSPSGKKLRSFGSPGVGHGQFQYPCGVAVDCNDNIFVADSQNHRIQKFSVDGEFLATVGTEGCCPLQFDRPSGIAYNKLNNKLYITDKTNHQVQILNSDLSHSNTFGRRGSGEGQFSYPMHLTCDSSGNVYVADRGNHRIQVFTADGVFLRMLGRDGGEAASPAGGYGSDGGGGTGLGSPGGISVDSGRRGKVLDSPYGVAIDSNGLIYVSEWGIHCVSIFTSEGHFLTSFGKWGCAPKEMSWRQYMSSFGRAQQPVGELKEPCGLTVDSCGVVYVCDYGNKCVHML